MISAASSSVVTTATLLCSITGGIELGIGSCGANGGRGAWFWRRGLLAPLSSMQLRQQSFGLRPLGESRRREFALSRRLRVFQPLPHSLLQHRYSCAPIPSNKANGFIERGDHNPSIQLQRRIELVFGHVVKTAGPGTWFPECRNVIAASTMRQGAFGVADSRHTQQHYNRASRLWSDGEPVPLSSALIRFSSVSAINLWCWRHATCAGDVLCTRVYRGRRLDELWGQLCGCASSGGYLRRMDSQGRHPGDLPVMLSARFDFVINLKTDYGACVSIARETPRLLSQAASSMVFSIWCRARTSGGSPLSSASLGITQPAWRRAWPGNEARQWATRSGGTTA
jgi:hypothetical protein